MIDTLRAVATIARMQLAVALRSPLAWLVALGFLVLEGVSFAALVAVLADPARPAPIGAVMETHFGGTLLSWAIQLTVLAALAARAAEDRRTGQWEVLVSAPVREGAAMVGVWLGALALYAILWVPTLLYVAALAAWSPVDAAIDPGPVVTGYAGQLAIGAAGIALALAAGAALRQPMVATVAGFALLVLWLVAGELPSLVPDLARDHPALAAALDRCAPRPIAIRLARGDLRAADLVWLAGLTAGALAAAAALVGAGRRRRGRVGLGAYRGALVAIAAGLAAVLVDRTGAAWDASASGRNHLARATTAALASLDGGDAPVTATVIRPGIAAIDPLYDEVERVLALMARAQPRLRVERWDPARDPGAAPAAAAAAVLDERELVRGGAVVFARGDRQRAVALLDLAEVGRDALAAPAYTQLRIEHAFARAVAELADDTPRTICATRGHGELDPDALAGGWGAVTARLADDGIAVEPVDDPLDDVPARCAALAVIGAAAELPAGAQLAIDRYLDRGGRLLVALPGRELAQPDGGRLGGSGVDHVLGRRGVGVPRAWVLDPAAAVDLPLAFRVVDGYGDHPIVAGFAGRRVTIWQRARPVVVAGPDARALVTASPSAYGASDPAGAARVAIDPPIAIAAAIEQGGTRVVVLGGAEAIGVDPAVRGQGTDLLAARALAWLVGRTPDISIPPKAGDRVRLVLDAGERRALAAFVIAGIPLLAVGLLVFLARRRPR